MSEKPAMPRFDQLLRAAFRNPLIVVLDLLFGVLVVSCLVNGAYRAAAYTAGFIVMLKLTFIVCSLLLARYRKPSPQPIATAKTDPKKGSAALTAVGVVLIALGAIPVLALFARLGFVPGLEAVRVLDYDLLIRLRSTAFEESKGLHLYALEYALRALLPIGVFFLLLARSALFVPALLFATLLAAGVMAKIYPIILIAPLVLYCVFAGRYVLGSLLTLFLVLVLSAQITTTNPALKLPILVVFDDATRDYMIEKSEALARVDSNEPPSQLKADQKVRVKLAEHAASLPDHPVAQTIDPATERYALELARRNEAEAANARPGAGPASGGSPGAASIWLDRFAAVGGGVGTALYKSLEAIYIRTVLLPGEVMSQWFQTIPSQQPYLGLCGYRIIALVMGCDYVHSPRRVFEIVYADSYVKRGIIGNLNAPGFLMDYANLGLLGVMLSALLLGAIIATFSTIFATNTAFLAVLMPYFALTTEAPISMILNSGGLGIAALILLAMHRYVPSQSAGRRLPG